MNAQQKMSVIKLLESVVNQGIKGQIRNAINQFRLNRRYVDIQRNFLKRLLLSKAGMVVIAFRRIQMLPDRIDRPLYERANKFEKGLSSFAEKVLRQSFSSFKSEFDEGQGLKKRSVIQMINTTSGGQKRMYTRWSAIT